jgi:hypothetical protein
VAGIATATVVLVTTAWAVAATGHGYDVSWPQCNDALPSDGDFRIVGVSGGKPYTDNDCLATQYRWAAGAAPGVAFYMNTANPGTASKVVNWYGQKSPNPGCGPSDEAACAFNYGYNAAKHAFEYDQAQTGAAGRWSWWLDVEIDNSWSPSASLNVSDLIGSIAYLRSQGVPVGAYSTGYQWGRITAGVQFTDVPDWVAGARNGPQAARWCGPDSSFTGGPVVLVQWVESDLDHNHACRTLPLATGPPPLPAPTPNLVEQLINDLLGGVSRLLTPVPK